ncbi:MAG: hypothetical protein ABI402_05030 [Ferruginibacter sp.]
MTTIIKYSRNVLLIIAVQSFLFFGCNKDGTTPCQNGGYSFVVSSQYSPQQDIYQVGDTIYFTSQFPKTLVDQINNSSVNYSNSVGIQGDIGFGYLDTITHQPIAARDSFTIFSIKGSFSERPGNQNVGLNFNYFENAENYEFQAAFVCKKRGIYTIGVSDLLSEGLQGENCTNAGFNLSLANTNQHLYLHQYVLNVDTTDQELQQKVYDFRVQ